ncbi:ubiquinol-cytochrome C reductase, partial [Streptomyces sp. TRM76130]|nr:ubiquinol-cytochrome C reductase [Streptomyces sp. TRM76130]
MSSQDIPENLPAAQDHSRGEVADEAHPFADPGLPPHEHRIQDV